MFKRNNNTMSRKRKGQSTVEYIILVAAVIAALLLFLPNVFKPAYNATLASGTDSIVDMAGRLQKTWPGATNTTDNEEK